jgi:hypothetical protein
MKKLLLITTALSLSAASAFANPLMPDNFYGGIDLSNTSANYNVTTSNSSESSDEGVAYGVNFGARYDVMNNIFIAPEVYYNVESANVIEPGYNAVSVNATYGIDAKIGYDFGEYNLYAIGGYTMVDFDNTTYDNPTKKSYDEGAGRYGIGSSFELSDITSIRMEYVKTDRISFDRTDGTATSQALDLSAVKIGVSYKF